MSRYPEWAAYVQRTGFLLLHLLPARSELLPPPVASERPS